MRATPRKQSLAGCCEEVTGRMQAGQAFEEVEDVIELADVTEEQKAALWLMAFSMQDRHDQARDARGYLALVTER